MSKWQILRPVNRKQSTPWFIVTTLALCFAFPGPASAQLAEPIDPVIRSVLIPGTASLTPDLSWAGKADDLTQDGAPVPDTSAGIPAANAEPSGRTSVMPGTIAKSSAMPLKPGRTNTFSVQPDYLPSWMTDQPLAYLRYGAAPAVVTIHFGHK